MKKVPELCLPETSLEVIQKLNLLRAQVWHQNSRQWTASDWGLATAGECGEMCNAIKKLNRHDDGIHSTNQSEERQVLLNKVAEEVGGTFLYLLLLCNSLGIDFARAVSNEFNRVSVREGFPYTLGILYKPGED